MVNIGPARYCARAHGNDYLWGRDGFVGFSERQSHIFSYRPCKAQAIGMAGRSDKLDAKTSQVKDHCGKHVQVSLARIAPARAHLAQFERSSENTFDLLSHCRGLFKLLARKNKALPQPACQTMVLGKTERS